MRKICVVALVMLVGLSVNCEALDQALNSGGEVTSPTPAPPATPDMPLEPSESGALPSTPKPADTPMSATTPFAVLPSYTPEPTATAAPRPTAIPIDSPSAREKREEYITRCKHWALRNLEPIEYSRFEELDPYNMTDLERVLWGSLLLDEWQVRSIDEYYSDDVDYGEFRFRGDHLEWCQDYWSEPLNLDNASKRNHSAWHILCLSHPPSEAWRLEENLRDAFEQYESEGMSAVIVNQYARILNWLDIDGETLLNIEPKPREVVRMVWEREDDGPSRYRERNRIGDWPLASTRAEDIEWWNIERAWQSDGWRSCKNYYPQLFFGRWVPLDDFWIDDEWLEEVQEGVAEQRDREDWPKWADAPDRDILIRLEN